MKTFLSNIIHRYNRDKVRIYSSSVSFYIIVSFLPLISIIFYILSFFSPSLSLSFNTLISSIIPREIYKELNFVLLSLKQRSSYALVPFSILTSIWGSTKGIGGICEGIEHIFKTQDTGGFFIKGVIRVWRTFLFYLLTIASLLIFALGKIVPKYEERLFIFKILLKLRILFFALILFLFFSLFYARLSHAKIKSQLMGGLFSSISWMIFTYFYSKYVSYAINSLSVYAELGTIIFFMLWIYFCVNIILIGAEINKVMKKTEDI